MKIVLVTYEDQGKYASPVENEDDKLLAFLQKKGLNVEYATWTDPDVDWKKYELAILKSPWDYFDKITQFYEWLSHLENLQVRLLNPYEIVRWNSDKHYLADIAYAGLPVTPSTFLEKGEQPELHTLFTKWNTEKLIIKPCISGGAKHTFAFTRTEVAQLTPQVHKLLLQESFLVQPFLPEIQAQGEWSMVFFNGKFSHSLLKKAKAGDFRVQHYLGGSIHAHSAPEYLLQQASRYIETFAPSCLYARVDGVAVDKTFVLMELELIEPFLFLFTHPQSYENYSQALQQLLKDR